MSAKGKVANKDGRQMSLLVTCNVCKKKVDHKKTLICATCKKAYEFDCIGYSQRLHLLKDIETRKKWICKVCTKTFNSEPSTSYVTHRKKHPAPKISTLTNSMMSTPKNEASISQLDSHILTLEADLSSDEVLSTSDRVLQRSLDYTVTDTVTIAELRGKIDQLQLVLASTQNELENYILENNDLRIKNSKLNNENTALKKICLSPLTDNHRIKKNNRLSMSHCSMLTPIRNTVPSKNDKLSDDLTTLQQRINKLEHQLMVAEEEILTLNKYIQILETNLHEENPASLLLNTPLPPSPKIKERQENKILIFGSQQCVGLSSALIRSRENTSYEKYTVRAQTKPHALASHVLMDCHNINLTSNDKLVIGIGENDYDMQIILSQLRMLLNRFRNFDIIVLNIFKNMYLNVDELNDNIRLLCNKYNNCNFVSCTDNSLHEICKSINFVIDCKDYDKKYLNVKELKKLIASINNSDFKKNSKNYPKGTIPYYFAPIQATSRSTSPDINRPIRIIKNKITDYFPTTSKKEFFRTS